jgi:hypothetical protein
VLSGHEAAAKLLGFAGFVEPWPSEEVRCRFRVRGGRLCRFVYSFW